jgi:hypothetical protein
MKNSPAVRCLALLAAKAGDRTTSVGMLKPAPTTSRKGFLGHRDMVCEGRVDGRKVWVIA